MNYKIYGDKKNTTFLILHGWGGSIFSWEKVANLLSKHFFVIVLKIPLAFDKQKSLLVKDTQNIELENEFKNKAYNLDDYANLIKEFIEKFNLKDFILFGHSNGGAIGTKIALKFPDLRIKKLILNNTAGIRKDRKRTIKRKILNFIAKIIKPVFKLPGMGKIRNLFYKIIGGQDYLEAEKNSYKKQTYLNMINEDLQADFQKIKNDTLLIWGENDTYTPLSDGKKINNLIKNSKLVIIKNVRHGIHLQKPEELVKIILENTKN